MITWPLNYWIENSCISAGALVYGSLAGKGSAWVGRLWRLGADWKVSWFEVCSDMFWFKSRLEVHWSIFIPRHVHSVWVRLLVNVCSGRHSRRLGCIQFCAGWSSCDVSFIDFSCDVKCPIVSCCLWLWFWSIVSYVVSCCCICFAPYLCQVKERHMFSMWKTLETQSPP